MRYIKARSEDMANGPGVRTSIWLSGCNNNCKGCFNPEAKDFNAGELLSVSRMRRFAEIGAGNKEVVGFSILGGEPLQQNKDEMLKFLKILKRTNKTIWMWTGYTYEELTQDQLEIVKQVNVLVDGPFIIEKRNPNLRFRGSSNQRIIDIKPTIKTGQITLHKLFY